MSDLAQRVIDVVVKQLGVDRERVNPDSEFAKDLGADSLDQTELVMALEDEFGCDIPDEVANKIKTVQQAIEYIQAHT